MRFTGPQDWQPVPIQPGHYANDVPLMGYQRRDGFGGNVLHPIHGDQNMEHTLAETYASLHRHSPPVRIERCHIRMPHWSGNQVPALDDYALLHEPDRLASTSVTVLTVPVQAIRSAEIGYHFDGHTLPALRQRILRQSFHGIIGNLGYYYTRGLKEQKFSWSHESRYPKFPVSCPPAYLGFYATSDPTTGSVHSTFPSAYPGAVAIQWDGSTVLLPRIELDSYTVHLGGIELAVEHVNDPLAVRSPVVAFTPACHTTQIDDLVARAERSGGQSTAWQTYAPLIPLADAHDRIHVLLANQGNAGRPVEHVAAIWEGAAPLPSFGTVFSFIRGHFQALFGTPEHARAALVGTPVQVIPHGPASLDPYVAVLGGLVPAVVEGQFLCAPTVEETLRLLNQHGNALSPLARAGQESRNFDPYIREPAGLLIQTASHIGWVLLDGRHELSIGASVVDALQILHKLQNEGILGQEIEQALFVDGGSAMKAYWVQSDSRSTELKLLNRVAAGSRNPAGNDPDGLNLYSTLALELE